jgi:hypothetical protein
MGMTLGPSDRGASRFIRAHAGEDCTRQRSPHTIVTFRRIVQSVKGHKRALRHTGVNRIAHQCEPGKQADAFLLRHLADNGLHFGIVEDASTIGEYCVRPETDSNLPRGRFRPWTYLPGSGRAPFQGNCQGWPRQCRLFSWPGISYP